MDPLELFHEDRARAREAEDPMAHLCTLANVDEHGIPQMRTLVLREVGQALAVFINATSPKWNHLLHTTVIHTYWPSVQVQFRMQVTTETVPDSVVHESWNFRPQIPKSMDWFYQQHSAQSSAIASREALIDQIHNVTLPSPLHAPENAKGLLLHPTEVERLDQIGRAHV